jgi:hypothetical protein
LAVQQAAVGCQLVCGFVRDDFDFLVLDIDIDQQFERFREANDFTSTGNTRPPHGLSELLQDFHQLCRAFKRLIVVSLIIVNLAGREIEMPDPSDRGLMTRAIEDAERRKTT